MDPTHFCYWLRGYTEITSQKLPSSGEWLIINDHLDAVFHKVTPNREPLYPEISGWFPSFGPTPTGSLDFSWYPESLRRHNATCRPEERLFC